MHTNSLLGHETHRGSRHRRGALLLLVLSVLTLFLMMGTLAILTATRARETSAAFATATASVENRAIVARALTNEALMLLIRGSRDAAINTMLGNDNLLEDMYGTQAKGPFVDEAYDAFDAANPFLTHMALDADGRPTHAIRPAFAVGSNAGQAPVVDNDGDGVPDGIWLPQHDDQGQAATEFFPSVQLKDRTYRFRVSYLVLELDSRANVNAHGRPVGDTRSASEAHGPADLDASTLIGSDAWSLSLLRKTQGQGPFLPSYDSGTVSPEDQWRQPLNLLNQRVDGRFGTSGLTRTYDLRLDLEAPRPAMLEDAPSQNPFTLGELERVLRQFDPDAATLPARLDGILGDRTERSRMRITTDSWQVVGDKADINWVAPNSGVNYERQFHDLLFSYASKVVPHQGHVQNRLKQWLANLIDFRDMDNANTNFSQGIRGAEPVKDGLGLIPGTWNNGFFLSYAALVGVPEGTPSQVATAAANGTTLRSMIFEFPQILETFMTPSPFRETLNIDPNREPGKININTCEHEVWKYLIGQDIPNPCSDPATPATNIGSMLLNVDLIFNGDATYDVRSVNHEVANRFANVATVRSHVFAVWITLEVSDTSPHADPPSYHRLFAIVDRSVPLIDLSTPPADRKPVEGSPQVTFVRGSNTHARNVIRLVRFLN